MLVTSEGYWDGLTANGVAGLANAPIVMTGSDTLSSQARAAISSLKPKTIVICGGVDAVSRNVEQAAARLGKAGFTVALNASLPPNEGCVSYGQAVVASASR